MKKIILILCLINPLCAAEEVLTWEDCISEAGKNHPDLTSASEQLRQARLDVKSSAAGLYPQMDLSASAGKSKSNSDSNSRDFSESDGTSFSAGVSAKQLVYDAGKTRQEKEKAMTDVTYQEALYRDVSCRIRQNLRLAFADCLKYQELLKLTREITRRRKQNLLLVKMRYDAGREHKGSLLTARASLEQANYESRQAARTLDIVARRLSKELGRTEYRQIKVKGDFNINSNISTKKDFETCIQTLPKVQAWKAQKESFRLGIKTAEADYKPKIYASLTASLRDSSFPPEGNTWNGGVQASWSIFDGGIRKAGIEKSMSKLNQAEAQMQRDESNFLVALEDAWATLQDAADFVNVQNQFLIAAKERSTIAQAQYSNGLISFDNWALIEDDWVNTKKSYLNAQAQALVAEANWIQARGGTLDEN